MNARNFVRGMGVGMVVGSAIGMTIGTVTKRGRQNGNKVSKALRTVGDIVENIGDALSM